MQNATRLAFGWKSLATFGVLFFWVSASSLFVNSQTGSQGQNAVYNSSNGILGSYAFIDASMFPATGRDFCGVLKFVLQNVDQPPAYPVGAVIDARGLPGNTQTNMKCSASPWAGLTSPPPSTILLPAQTITRVGQWYPIM
jgi:hypothetical protein